MYRQRSILKHVQWNTRTPNKPNYTVQYIDRSVYTLSFRMVGHFVGHRGRKRGKWRFFFVGRFLNCGVNCLSTGKHYFTWGNWSMRQTDINTTMSNESNVRYRNGDWWRRGVSPKWELMYQQTLHSEWVGIWKGGGFPDVVIIEV